MFFKNKSFSFGKKSKKFTFGSGIDTNKQIKDVKACENNPGIGINKKEDLAKIVDEPCLRACEELFDKNIRTFDSGCNQQVSDRAYVSIAYDSLDLKNKLLVQKLISEKKAFLIKTDFDYYDEDVVQFKISTTPDDLVIDVSDKLCKAVSVLKKQEKIIEKDPRKGWNQLYRFRGVKPNPEFLPEYQKEIYHQWIKTLDKQHS